VAQWCIDDPHMQEPFYSTLSPGVLLLGLFYRGLSVSFTYRCSVCRDVPSILQISATDVLVSAYSLLASLIFSGESAGVRPQRGLPLSRRRSIASAVTSSEMLASVASTACGEVSLPGEPASAKRFAARCIGRPGLSDPVGAAFVIHVGSSPAGPSVYIA